MKVYRKTVESFVRFVHMVYDLDLTLEDMEYITDQIVTQKPLPEDEVDSSFIVEWDGADWKKFFDEVLEEKYGVAPSKENRSEEM